MAVRQYIGARYVAKIYVNSQDASSADWESGVAYEPLTMVTYNSSSYISRKDVPASVGNPVDNPTYWAVTGLYNGQIIALDGRITAIETLDGDGQLNTTADDFTGAINELNSRVTDNSLMEGVSLASYDSSDNKYTAPTDGYIKVTNNGGEGYIEVYINYNNLMMAYFHSTDPYETHSLFIKKGMNVYYNKAAGLTDFYISFVGISH